MLTVALAVERSLVVGRNVYCTVVLQSTEDGEAEVDIVRAGLASMLDEPVTGMGCGESQLLATREVEIVDGESDRGDGVWWRRERL